MPSNSEQRKENYKRNREKELIQQREYYKNNKEKCLEYQRNYRKLNKEKVRERQNSKRLERKIEAIKHLGNKCTICNVEYPHYIYDFHHINTEEKDFLISEVIGMSPNKFWEEVNKCQLVCANCHRIIHNEKK